jgi:hypothetical protein
VAASYVRSFIGGFFFPFPPPTKVWVLKQARAKKKNREPKSVLELLTCSD